MTASGIEPILLIGTDTSPSLIQGHDNVIDNPWTCKSAVTHDGDDGKCIELETTTDATACLAPNVNLIIDW